MKYFFIILFFKTLYCYAQFDTVHHKVKSDSARYYIKIADTTGDRQLQEIYYNKAISLEPDNYFVNQRKLLSYQIAGRRELYEKGLHELIKKFPNEGESYLYLGMLYEENGKIAQSYRQYTLANQRFKVIGVDEYSIEPFLKMMTLLLLEKKEKAKDVISLQKEDKMINFLNDYYAIMSNMDRKKLFQFIKNDLK